MREIKFRAKRLDNREWICGDLHLHSPFPHIHSTRGDKAKINTNTIGQFTGLRDKNGKEIYEGDVLFVREWQNLAFSMFTHEDREQLSLEDCKGKIMQEGQKVVYFEEGSMCAGDFYMCTLSDKVDQRHRFPIFEVEVIGNIYDNPELPKTGE